MHFLLKCKSNDQRFWIEIRDPEALWIFGNTEILLWRIPMHKPVLLKLSTFIEIYLIWFLALAATLTDGTVPDRIFVPFLRCSRINTNYEKVMSKNMEKKDQFQLKCITLEDLTIFHICHNNSWKHMTSRRFLKI